MKYLFLFVSVISFCSFGQITVNANLKIEKDLIEKTIFVYRESDENNLDEMKAVLTKNWDYNSLEFMSVDDFSNYEMNENVFIFSITYDYLKTYSAGSYNMTTGQTTGGSAANNFVDFYLTLSMIVDTNITELAKASLSISGPTLVDVCRTKKTAEEIISNQYKTHDVYSWNLAYLGTVMKTISVNIEDGTSCSPAEIAEPEIANLKSEKLYMSDAIEVKHSRSTGKETTMDYQEMVDKEYDYDFEIISNEKINGLASDNEGYLLMFQKIGRGKVILILDLVSMKIIFSHTFFGSYNFDKKDIKYVNKVLADLN